MVNTVSTTTIHEQMDAFADEFLFDPLGEGVASARPLSWVGRLQARACPRGTCLIWTDTSS